MTRLIQSSDERLLREDELDAVRGGAVTWTAIALAESGGETAGSRNGVVDASDYVVWRRHF